MSTMRSLSHKFSYSAMIAVIIALLLLATVPPTGMRAADEPGADQPVAQEKPGEKIAGEPAEQETAKLTANLLIESAKAAGAEKIEADFVKKTFAEIGPEKLSEPLAQTSAKNGFNLYVQCWGDGYIHLRAFDNYGNFYCLSDSHYGDIATDIACSGGEWSVQVLSIQWK